MLTLGSLFDGIGGWQLAATHNGVTPVFSSEIEAFPCAVTKKHFSETLQLGDITKLDGAKIPPVDIICAGSPCQDFSVAKGKREGLKGERSGLFIRAVELVRSMRRRTNGKYPRFFVFENVPGVFSSNKGMDFRAVLEEITEAEIPMPENNKWADAGMVEWDGGSLAWRILDAQYWGVPQRRKRIFLVADFTGHSAGQILFERESVRWDSSEGRAAREGTAAGVESGIGSTVRTYQNTGRGWWNESPIAETLKTPCGGDSTKANLVSAGFKHKASPSAGNIGYKVETAPTPMGGQTSAVAVYDMTHADEVMRKVPDGRAPTLNARMGTGGNQVPVVSYAIAGNTIDRQIQNGGNGKGVLEEKSYTLNTVDRHAVCVGNGQLDQARLSDKVGALNCMHDQQAVMIQKTVRRLTPTECERLQGLPDGYTLIDDKTCSDTARYKALGNGMAMPCANYVIRRIVEVCGDAT